jgi:ornithine cyclodeaminase/alanine dehydrogenase
LTVGDNRLVTLYLTEADVGSLLDPGAAVPVLEDCFRRMAGGGVDLLPRRRFPLEGGSLAVMAAADAELGVAGLKSYAAVGGDGDAIVCLFSAEDGSLEALIAAQRLGQVRTGAASGVAAKHLARAGAATLGLIGSGYQAESQLAAIRAAVPTLERAVAWSRSAERVSAFCTRTGAEPADSAQEAAACDVVVTATNAADPVLRGEWLREGALVCAIGANRPGARELDNAVLERASFVCCDSLEDARLESADLIEPVATGTLDWLEVHELHEVVAGELPGRQADTDIVLFKSNGIAPWDLAIAAEAVRLARERGVGLELDL